MSFDPKTDEIKTIYESLIGCKINIGYTINLKSGENLSGEINNCNIIGDCGRYYLSINKKIYTNI